MKNIKKIVGLIVLTFIICLVFVFYYKIGNLDVIRRSNDFNDIYSKLEKIIQKK